MPGGRVGYRTGLEMAEGYGHRVGCARGPVPFGSRCSCRAPPETRCGPAGPGSGGRRWLRPRSLLPRWPRHGPSCHPHKGPRNVNGKRAQRGTQGCPRGNVCARLRSSIRACSFSPLSRPACRRTAASNSSHGTSAPLPGGSRSLKNASSRAWAGVPGRSSTGRRRARRTSALLSSAEKFGGDARERGRDRAADVPAASEVRGAPLGSP